MASHIELHDLGVPFTLALEKMQPGEVVTIANHGTPVAQLVAVPRARPHLGRGLFKGPLWIADDFTSPLTEDELSEWEK